VFNCVEVRKTWLSWLETPAWSVDTVKRRRLNYIDYYKRLSDKYYSKGFPPAPFCKDVGVIQTDKPTCWTEHLSEWYEVEDTGIARDFMVESCTDHGVDMVEFINPTMMRPGSDQWHVHFTSNPIAAYLPFDRYHQPTLRESHAVAGRTARCSCKFRYVSKFTAASRGFHCDSTAF